jgi:hypothetical protein
MDRHPTIEQALTQHRMGWRVVHHEPKGRADG